MSVILEFSMYPIGEGKSLSKYIAESLDIITKSGINYRFGAMGTILEGEFKEVTSIVEKCYENMKKSCDRIMCNISIDYRKGRIDGLDKKIESVESKLGRKLKK